MCFYTLTMLRSPPCSVPTPLPGAPPAATDPLQGVHKLSICFSVLSLGCFSNAVTDLPNVKSLLLAPCS